MPATSACFWEMEPIMGKNMCPQWTRASQCSGTACWETQRGSAGSVCCSCSTFSGLIPQYLGIAKVAACWADEVGPLGPPVSHFCGTLLLRRLGNPLQDCECQAVSPWVAARGCGGEWGQQILVQFLQWEHFWAAWIALPTKLHAAALSVDTSIFQWLNVQCPGFFFSH